MQDIKMFYASWCPHCKNAKKYINELKEENSNYKKIKFELIDIDEEPEKTKGLEFQFVPAFYFDDEKIFEGTVTKDKIKKLLDKALS